MSRLAGLGHGSFGHAQYGVAAIINAAETARIQGVDLFASEQKRLSAMLELHSKYLNGASVDLCNTQIAGVDAGPMWEIGYNAYANMQNLPLPATQNPDQVDPSDRCDPSHGLGDAHSRRYRSRRPVARALRAWPTD